MGEDRRRDPMAPGLPAGASAAIDFTAGEMTLLCTLIAGPPTLNRCALSREFCRRIGWLKPDSGLKDMMTQVTMLTDRPATPRPNGYPRTMWPLATVSSEAMNRPDRSCGQDEEA